MHRLLLVCTFALAASAAAQQFPGVNIGTGAAQKAAPAPGAPPAPDLKAKLAAAQSELDRFVAEGASQAPPGTPPEEVIERRSLLEMIVRSLERQLDARDDLAIVQRNRAALAAKVKAWPGLGPGPHSLSLADGLRESAQTAAERVKAAESKLALFDGEIESFRTRLKDAEAKGRLADERASETTTRAETARRAWARELALLRVRALGVVLAGLDIRSAVAREELAEQREALEFAQAQVSEASKSMSFTREDYDRVLARLAKDHAALQAELAETQARASARRDALAKAQADLAAARDAPWRPGESPETAARRRIELERAVALARVQAENANLAYDVARALLDAAAADRAIWEYRFQLANEKDGAKLRETYERVDTMLAQMVPWRQFAQREVALARSQVREQETRLADAVLVDERNAGRDLIAAYRDRVAIYDRALRAIERQQGSLERWKAEFDDGRHVRPMMAYVGDAYYGARKLAREIWNFELFTAEDAVEVDGRKIVTTRSVTVGKSVGAVLVLALGYLASAWLVRRLERQLVSRFGADPNVARIARRWLQVILVAVLFVLALDLVKIPLTVFAFLGGALAIAFGFGAQNLLKNLISGIMLLVERPLKVGDLVEIGGIVGKVTNISIRSSTIRTAEGIETLVPNSALVESNVTNWTLSSSEVRRTVRIGVAYGSDTRKVSDTLLAQADRHGQVLKAPAPRVIFEDFGDNALVFALEFWIDFGKGADSRQIASDLRFMTEKALAEAGIAVPFPQRDVHLDTGGPLKVEVVSRAEPQALRRDARG
jgi:potassium-dependent mechanosensitive channel